MYLSVSVSLMDHGGQFASGISEVVFDASPNNLCTCAFLKVQQCLRLYVAFKR